MKSERKKASYKRIIAHILLSVFIISNILSLSAQATQINLLGTNAALGSPLVSENFTVDDWNSWEMLCFGIFLSNFCQPFEDDYASAFTEGASQGSKGRGLKALQFAAGGDVNTSGYLADMVSYCKESQAEAYKPLYVRYGYYEYDENVGNEVTGDSRIAYFDDLIPVLSNFQRDFEDEIKIETNSTIERPLVAYGILQDYDNLSSNILNKTYVDYAVIPTFYTTPNRVEEAVVFDMTENWDIQILKALFAKAFDKYASSDFAVTEESGMDDDEGLNEELKKFIGQKCPLILDTYGNICIQYQGRQIIIIPASANQHITKTPSYNYVNSLVLNNFILSDAESNVIANAKEEPISSATGILWWRAKFNSVGNLPVRHTEEIKDGKLLITSDSDTQLMKSIYEILKNQEPKKDVSYSLVADVGEGKAELAYKHNVYPGTIISEINFGKCFSDLLDKNSMENQAIQFHITGANSVVKETKRDVSKPSVETVLGAYGLLSTLFSIEGDNADVLDYFYVVEADNNLENTKLNLFSDAYYLAPSLTSDDSDGSKLYLNYFCKAMEGDTSGLDLKLDSVFTTEMRDKLYENLKVQKGFSNSWFSIISTDNPADKELHNLKANVIYKSFLKTFYKMRNESDADLLLNAESSISETDALFDSSQPLVSSYNMKYAFPSSTGTDYKTLTRVLKVYNPSSGFKALASVFNLEEGCQFELYSTSIYITYLEFYGLLGGKNNHNFNETLFDKGYFKNFLGENFKNGKTKEQMEEEAKINYYNMLSLDKKGKDYRKSLFKSFIESTCVEPLDDAMNKSGIGNVGAETSFLKVSMLEDNFLIGDIVKNHWKQISILLFGALSLIAIVAGAFSNKTLSWYLTILVASTTMVYSVPFYLDIAPIVIEKYINSNYKSAGSYWSLAESVEYDKNSNDLGNSGDDNNKLISLLNTLNFLDTDSSLMIKLDISQKVISNTGLNSSSYTELQRMKSARWLLPSLMRQISSDDGSYDYVSVPVTRLYDNFSKIWIMYHGVAENVTTFNTKTEDTSLLDLTEKESLWYGYENKNGYKSTAPAIYGASNSTKSISRVQSLNSESTHTGFYMLDDLKIQSVYDVLQKEYVTKDDWINYTNKVKNKDIIVPGAFIDKANELLNDLNSYNQYTGELKQEFGYLWTTENLGTYFYLLAKDTFDEAGAGQAQNLKSLMVQLQGSYTEDDSGNEVRTSFMHYGTTGHERDVCDMEEVFTNLMPYMYQMMILANGDNDHNGILGTSKMVGNQFYSNNYQSWMFRTNWITKIYEDNLYSSSKVVVSKNEDGTINGEYLVENISEPRCYPEERPMVFSEAQMYKQHLTPADLTFTELKILDFNRDVIRRWTTLVNYSNTEGLKKEHIYRQMAMEALFAFNETFTRDNILMKSKTLYPTNFDLRSISLITILRSLVCNLTNSNSYMYGDIALSLYQNNGFWNGYIAILFIYISMILFGWIRDFYMVFAFISALATLFFNFGSNSKNKFKSMFGWIITSVLFCILTMSYYCITNFLIGTPTADTLVNFQSVTSTRLPSIPLILWSLFYVILTGCYIGILIFYFLNLWFWHKFGLSIKDGGFGFYYQLADKAITSIAGAAEKVGNKFSGGFRHWSSGISEKINNSQLVKTNKDEPLEVVNKDKKTTNTNEDLIGSDLSSVYNNGQISSGENVEITNIINNRIESNRREAASENGRRADIKER